MDGGNRLISLHGYSPQNTRHSYPDKSLISRQHRFLIFFKNRYPGISWSKSERSGRVSPKPSRPLVTYDNTMTTTHLSSLFCTADLFSFCTAVLFLFFVLVFVKDLFLFYCCCFLPLRVLLLVVVVVATVVAVRGCRDTRLVAT